MEKRIEFVECTHCHFTRQIPGAWRKWTCSKCGTQHLVPDTTMWALHRDEHRPWRIWFQHFDKEGRPYAAGVLIEEYSYKSNATRAAKKKWGVGQTKTKWIVSRTNPWLTDAKYDREKVVDHLLRSLS